MTREYEPVPYRRSLAYGAKPKSTYREDKEDQELKANPFHVGQVVVCSRKDHHTLTFGETYVISEIVHGPYTWKRPRVKVEGFPRQTFLADRFSAAHQTILSSATWKELAEKASDLFRIPIDESIPQETEGFELFSASIIPQIEPAVDDPIRDWKRRAALKALQAKVNNLRTTDEPDPEPKKGPDLTGIERAKENMAQDGLILAARRGTEVKND